MIGFNVSQAKNLFFDRLVLETAAEKAEAAVMSKFGKFVRRTAQLSIKTRQKRVKDLDADEREKYDAAVAVWKAGGKQGPRPLRPLASSQPGKPPNNHTGLLRNKIFYGYDPFRRSVIIGPFLLNNSKKTLSPEGKTVPQVLEEGGAATLTYWDRDRRTMATKSIFIQPRPYMKPAFDENLPKVPGLWRDSIKAA